VDFYGRLKSDENNEFFEDTEEKGQRQVLWKFQMRIYS
jgi:hypothetical protein